MSLSAVTPTIGDPGLMTERLTIQTRTISAKTVSSLTRAGSTATATTSTAHGYNTGDYVTIAGATQTEYNGTFKVTVTTTTVFTYPVSGSPVTPATGTITATYDSDKYRGRSRAWGTLATVWGERLALFTGRQETLQGQAQRTEVIQRFRIRDRSDVTSQMRVSIGSDTFEVRNRARVWRGRVPYLVLECVELAE